MASFEDYAPGGAKDPRKQEGLQAEITDAGEQHQERQRNPETGQFTSTPEGGIDWENRYKELEQHNSRQAQELGSLRNENTQYKTAFDEYLLQDNPTPAEATTPDPVSSDDLFERPDEVINQAIDNHPAIREQRKRAEAERKRAILAAKTEFEEAHPNYQETMSDPEFAAWVRQNRTRLELAQRADQWDFGAADALFSLYESEQRLSGVQQQAQTDRAIEQAALESAGVGDPPPDPKYSRHEMRELMIAAKRGDPESERKLQIHLPLYRAALAAGEVTD